MFESVAMKVTHRTKCPHVFTAKSKNPTCVSSLLIKKSRGYVNLLCNFVQWWAGVEMSGQTVPKACTFWQLLVLTVDNFA